MSLQNKIHQRPKITGTSNSDHMQSRNIAFGIQEASVHKLAKARLMRFWHFKISTRPTININKNYNNFEKYYCFNYCFN